MISDNLYLEAERAGITVICGAKLPKTKSVSVQTDSDEMFIGIDDSVMQSRAEERVHLAHELGHCMTGAFYNMYSPIDNRSRCEHIANKYAIERLIDVDELKKVIDSYDGDISIWALSEHFCVTEDFMRKAVAYYFED